MIKAVWYQALRASFAAEFALDSELQMVRTLGQNFEQIKTLLGANTVLIRLMDQDAWCGQYGGGFSYNPAADPRQVLIDYKDGTPPFLVHTRPDFMIRRSVAQEIILSIAHKYELDVVFVIELSDYHANTNDLDKYENEVGAYNYIQQYFDPTLYYGQQTTTQLPAVGLDNSTSRSYLNDTRIAGWLLEPEWDPNAVTGEAISGHQLELFQRYWAHFQNLVHFRDPGANERRHFAGIYLVSPDGQDRSQLGTLISSYKTLMFEQRAPPDVFGFAWYGNGNYDTSQIGPDIEFMVNEMGKPDPVAVSPDTIALLEGGCNQVSNPARLSFYRDAIQRANQLGLKGIAVWEADGYSNLGPNQSGGNTDPNPEFSLLSQRLLRREVLPSPRRGGLSRTGFTITCQSTMASRCHLRLRRTLVILSSARNGASWNIDRSLP